MTLLKKLIWWKRRPVRRVRICIECGMPIAEHKEWCSIFRVYSLQQSRSGAES